MPTGKYNVEFTVVPGYSKPVPMEVDIQEGEAFDAGTVTIGDDPAVGSGTIKGTMSWVVGGKTYNATVFAGSISVTSRG